MEVVEGPVGHCSEAERSPLVDKVYRETVVVTEWHLATRITVSLRVICVESVELFTDSGSYRFVVLNRECTLSEMSSTTQETSSGKRKNKKFHLWLLTCNFCFVLKMSTGMYSERQQHIVLLFPLQLKSVFKTCLQCVYSPFVI